MQIRNQSFTLILHSFHSFVYAENVGCGPSVRLFANEGKIICNGNVLSCFGISTNYRGQDQIPTKIWKLSSEQGRDERTIQQINSCPVTKKKGNLHTSKLSLLFQRRKTTVYIIPKYKGTLLEKSLSQKEMSFSRNKF